MTAALQHITLPPPPAELAEYAPDVHAGAFAPALELWPIVKALFVLEDGAVYNERHEHLELAEIGFLWTNAVGTDQGRSVLGTAEIFFPRGKAWQKARQKAQMLQWFGEALEGELPDFVITLSAPYVAECLEKGLFANVGALLDHELCHCGQALDRWGNPRFSQSGRPIWRVVGHDVEEFVDVVERWGPDAAGVRDMVEAARRGPTIAPAQIDGLCGTCMRRVA